MLPSKGYFKSFNCPFYDNGLCERPHCHYRHTKREKFDVHNISSSQTEEIAKDNSLVDIKSNKLNKKTFTEAVEKFLLEDYLNKSADTDSNSADADSIISKVYSELTSPSSATYSSTSDVPSYKPTPISELKKRHIPVAYAPNIVKCVIPKSKSSAKKPKIEYVPKGENGIEPNLPDYSPTPSNQIAKNKSQEYLPVEPSWNHIYTPSKITDFRSSNEFTSTEPSYLSDSNPPLYSMDLSPPHDTINDNFYHPSRVINSVNEDDLDLDDIAPELDMISEIVDSVDAELKTRVDETIDKDIVNSDIGEIKLCNKNIKNISDNKGDNEQENDNKEIKTDVIDKVNLKENEKIDESMSVLSEKHSNIKTDKIKEHKSKYKSKHKSSNSKSSDKHSSLKIHDSKSSSSKHKHIKDKHRSSSSSTSSKDKSSHSSSSSNIKSDTDSKSKQKQSSERKHSHNEKTHLSDKQKSQKSHKNSNEDKNGNKYKSEKEDHKRNKHSKSHSHDSKRSIKQSSKSSLKRKLSSDSDKTESIKRKKSKQSAAPTIADDVSSSSSDVEEVPLHSPVDAIVITDSEESTHDVSNYNASDNDDSDNSESHYESEKLPDVGKNTEVPLPELKERKRIAHSNAENGRKTRFQPPTARTVTDPEKALLERWQKLKSLQETERPPTEEPFQYKGPSQGKVRIAHVPNVSSLLNAKKNLLLGSIKKQDTSQVPGKIVPKAVPNKSIGSKPSVDPPLIAPVDNSKIPVVKRQIHLNKLFEICLQIYNNEFAKIKATQAEKEICETSKSFMTYTNKVLQTLVGLKKEVNILTGVTPPVTEKMDQSEEPSVSDYEYMIKFLVAEEEFVNSSIPIKHTSEKNCAFLDVSTFPKKFKSLISKTEDTQKYLCINCGIYFSVDDKGYSIERNCRFHYASSLRIKQSRCGRVRYYDCCNAEESTGGCVTNKYHVREVTNYSCMPGFRETRPAPSGVLNTEYGIYAVDCEMCYTTVGSELVRCTVIDINKRVVYDHLVKTEHPIIDYCTKFSGITAEKMVGAYKTLVDVQNDLLGFIYAETILIGHGIGNDLKSLKLIHRKIIDTTVVFPHRRGPPFKRRLADITSEFLQRQIQVSELGHDSTEDAVACMDLMLIKVKELKKAAQPRKIISYNGKK